MKKIQTNLWIMLCLTLSACVPESEKGIPKKTVNQFFAATKDNQLWIVKVADDGTSVETFGPAIPGVDAQKYEIKELWTSTDGTRVIVDIAKDGLFEHAMAGDGKSWIRLAGRTDLSAHGPELSTMWISSSENGMDWHRLINFDGSVLCEEKLPEGELGRFGDFTPDGQKFTIGQIPSVENNYSQSLSIYNLDCTKKVIYDLHPDSPSLFGFFGNTMLVYMKNGENKWLDLDGSELSGPKVPWDSMVPFGFSLQNGLLSKIGDRTLTPITRFPSDVSPHSIEGFKPNGTIVIEDQYYNLRACISESECISYEPQPPEEEGLTTDRIGPVLLNDDGSGAVVISTVHLVFLPGNEMPTADKTTYNLWVFDSSGNSNVYPFHSHAGGEVSEFRASSDSKRILWVYEGKLNILDANTKNITTVDSLFTFYNTYLVVR